VGTPFRRNASRMSASVSTPSPDAAAFTGERFLRSCSGEIAYEHWPRYAFAQRFVHGKRVLDGRLTVYWGDVVAALCSCFSLAAIGCSCGCRHTSRTSCKTVRMNSHLHEDLVWGVRMNSHLQDFV
jgi:hypothetical protein